MALKQLWNRWFAQETTEIEPRDQDYEGRQEPPLPPNTEEERADAESKPASPPPTESV